MSEWQEPEDILTAVEILKERNGKRNQNQLRQR